MAWSPLQEIVTLDQFKQHLNLSLDVDTQDEDLALKLLIAHEQVFDYLTQRLEDDDTEGEWQATVDAWTPETAPRRVVGSILAQGTYLYRFRGDDDRKTPEDGEALCREARSLVYRMRDPAIG